MVATLTTLTRPEPHPILPVFSPEEIDALLATPEGAARYVRWLNAHNERLRLAQEDPLYHGLSLDCWNLADEQLADPEVDLQINFGWNRGGGKTYRAIKRLCEAALEYPAHGSAGYLVLGETEDSLKFVQMPLVWMFLRKYIEHLNGKQKGPYRVTHKPGTGFTEGLVIIPSGPVRNEAGDITGFRSTSNIWFDTYKGDPGKYEGREFGGRLPIIGRTESDKAIVQLSRRSDPAARGGDSASRGEGDAAIRRRWEAKWLIQNVGVVADEGLALNWLRMIKRRAPYRQAKIIWSYTPIKGITSTIKEAVGVLQVEESAPADKFVKFDNFVPDVPGCPAGHMPVTGKCAMPRTKAVYFHIDRQCFNDYFNIVRADCTGKDQRYIERIAYGYSRDTVDRQFGNFGPHNIVKVEHLPARGTNYMICDPADVRPTFTIWVRVVPGMEPELPEYWIYRDWPDAATFGEWAMATERELSEDTIRGWDGDRGPAQANPDLGYAGQKRVWLECERVSPTSKERDPYRKALQIALTGRLENELDHARNITPGRDLPAAEKMQGLILSEKIFRREEVFERVVDSRFGPRLHQVEHGMTCWVWEMEKEHTDPANGEKLEPLFFRMADGSAIDLHCIKELLEYQRGPDGKITRPPRLFVSEDCHQVIWALNNYTGKSKEAGASKDVIDTIRYMAGANLIPVDAGTFGSRGGGSY